MRSTSELIDGRMATLRSTATSGIGVAIADTTQDTLLSDLQFGLEFRQKFALSTNIKQLNHFLMSSASNQPTLSPNGIIDTYAWGGTGTNSFYRGYETATRFANKNWAIAFLFKAKLSDYSSGYRYSMFLSRDKFFSGQREIAVYSDQNALTSCQVTMFFNNDFLALITGLVNDSNYLIIINHSATDKKLTFYVNNSLVTNLLKYNGSAFVANTPSASEYVYSGTLSEYSQETYIGDRNTGSGFNASASTSYFQHLYKWDRLLTSAERDWLFNSGSYRFLSK